MEPIKYFHQPTISESLGNGWYTMKKYFLYLLLAVIVAGIVKGPIKFGVQDSDVNMYSFGIMALLMIIGLTFGIMIAPVFKYGANMMFLQGARDQEPEPTWLIKGFQLNYFNIVLANLLFVAIVAISFVFLIIPGIIAACRLAFVSYLVMDKNLGPIEAVEESWRMTKGHGWTIFGLALVSFFILILGVLCFVVGVFPAAIWVQSSFASLYQSILVNEGSN